MHVKDLLVYLPERDEHAVRENVTRLRINKMLVSGDEVVRAEGRALRLATYPSLTKKPRPFGKNKGDARRERRERYERSRVDITDAIVFAEECTDENPHVVARVLYAPARGYKAQVIGYVTEDTRKGRPCWRVTDREYFELQNPLKGDSCVYVVESDRWCGNFVPAFAVRCAIAARQALDSGAFDSEYMPEPVAGRNLVAQADYVLPAATSVAVVRKVARQFPMR